MVVMEVVIFTAFQHHLNDYLERYDIEGNEQCWKTGCIDSNFISGIGGPKGAVSLLYDFMISTIMGLRSRVNKCLNNITSYFTLCSSTNTVKYLYLSLK